MKDREYKRVMAFVKDGIRSGEFQVGSKLPTEREMAETLGMSRPSIREALKSMENIGLIESQQGSGRYYGRSAAGFQSMRDSPYAFRVRG